MEDLPNEPIYEAAGLLIDRRSHWRRRGLYVTDFCASEWCQQQAAFELTAKVPKVGLTALLGALTQGPLTGPWPGHRVNSMQGTHNSPVRTQRMPGCCVCRGRQKQCAWGPTCMRHLRLR